MSRKAPEGQKWSKIAILMFPNAVRGFSSGVRWSSTGVRWSSTDVRWSSTDVRWSSTDVRWSSTGVRWSSTGVRWPSAGGRWSTMAVRRAPEVPASAAPCCQTSLLMSCCSNCWKNHRSCSNCSSCCWRNCRPRTRTGWNCWPVRRRGADGLWCIRREWRRVARGRTGRRSGGLGSSSSGGCRGLIPASIRRTFPKATGGSIGRIQGIG